MSSRPVSLSLLSEDITPDVASPPLDSPPPPSLQVMVFTLDDQTFALPLISVLKVLDCPPDLDAQVDQLGVFYLGQAAIKLLSPHRSAIAGVQPQAPPTSFLIVLQARSGMFYGIPVNSVPDVTELPLPAFHLLPDVQSHQGLFNFVRYVAILTEAENTSSRIYLLDLKQIAHA
jgi:chemotaxis signal transduction protein